MKKNFMINNSKARRGPTTNMPILLDRSIAKSCFDMYQGCGDDVNLEDNDIKMLIRKAGTCQHLIQYPAFEISENTVCFYWDHLFYDREPGRYIGDLFIDDKKVSEVQFQLGSPYKMGGIQLIERTGEVDCGD